MATVKQYLSNNIAISPASLGFSAVRETLERYKDPFETPLFINLDSRSEQIRNSIIISLEMAGKIGRRVGYHRQIILYRRQGSLLEIGELDDEDQEGNLETRKWKRWQAFLAAMEEFDVLYAKVAQKLAIADEAIDQAIKNVGAKIKELKAHASIENQFDDATNPISATAKLANNITDPLKVFQNLSEPHQRLAKAQTKQERLKELRSKIRGDYARDISDDGGLPNESRLKDIQSKIDTTKENIPEFNKAYKIAKDEMSISKSSLFISGLAGFFSGKKKTVNVPASEVSASKNSQAYTGDGVDYNNVDSDSDSDSDGNGDSDDETEEASAAGGNNEKGEHLYITAP